MRWTAAILFISLLQSGSHADLRAKGAESAADLRSLMREVCSYQIAVLDRHDTRLIYRIHRVDAKGNTTRDQIETHSGSVARLLEHNDQALTEAENQGERNRLSALLGSGKLAQRDHEEAHYRAYGDELLRAMPDAMLFSAAPQQDPVPDVKDPQLVIDFSPDPAFHPATLAQAILPQLFGRVWVDEADHHLLRMELHNRGDVNLAWGVLARVYAGGTITYDQRKFQDVYVFTHIAVHLKVRELMVKTNVMNTETVADNFRRLPNSPDADDAIRMLLAEPVVTR